MRTRIGIAIATTALVAAGAVPAAAQDGDAVVHAIADRVELSTLVEVEGAIGEDFDGNSFSDVVLATVAAFGLASATAAVFFDAGRVEVATAAIAFSQAGQGREEGRPYSRPRRQTCAARASPASDFRTTMLTARPWQDGHAQAFPAPTRSEESRSPSAGQ